MTSPRAIDAGRRLPLIQLCSLVLAACGGESGGGGNGRGNVAPVANAGADRTVVEQTFVELAGAGSDANTGDILRFAWTQLGGRSVTIANANEAQASFMAPDVSAGSPEALTFRLTVTDPSGLSDSDDVTITVQEPGPAVTISGQARYEFVPPNPGCLGLNYAATELRPIRAATVQVIDAASGNVLGVDVADDGGNYAITVDPGINVFLRVRAELKRGGTPAWDVEVRDNTSATNLPPGQRPVYVLDSAAFGTGAFDQTRNVTATSGWGGSSYTGVRAAAPFAVLDAIYAGIELVLSVDPVADFAALDAFWSINNRPAQPADGGDGIDTGDIGTSFYRSDINALFLLGAANSDTEEFDDHVIVHEWGHYFEDVFSRSDSIGGSHGFGDRLDMRVAFGEGWATALSGIALGNASYCDTQGNRQANGFRIDIENDTPSPRGWFNEFSVMALIFDLWDDTVELGRGDSGSIGFQPIYDTMVERQRATPAHTSIFSFSDHLVDVAPSAMALVDGLRAYHDISGSGIYGAGETNDAGSATPQDALPVYTEIMPNGTPVNFCSNREHDNSNANGNRLSEHRFLRMTITVPARYEFDIATDAATLAQLPPDDPADPVDQSDPDVYFYLNGQIQNRFVNGQLQGQSGVANRERFTTPNLLPAGDYVMDVVEFRHRDSDTDRAEFPARACFDMTIRAAP